MYIYKINYSTLMIVLEHKNLCHIKINFNHFIFICIIALDLLCRSLIHVVNFQAQTFDLFFFFTFVYSYVNIQYFQY